MPSVPRSIARQPLPWGAVVRDALGAADGALEGAGTADGAAEGRMSEPKTRDEAVVKIACVQMEPVVGEKERNVRRTLERVEQAAARGARLVVLPELCNSGYVFESRDEAFALAEEIPNGPTCQAWKDVARKHGLHLVAGIGERDGQALYNTAVVIGPSGHVGTFRKVHLWNEENLFFEPGNVGFPVFRTPLGRIATLIIYAEVNLADARRKRNWNEYNQVLRDRRTDVYDEMLGAQMSRGWY